MRLLVTGATGLLGSDLCRTLQDQYKLVGWARRIPPAQAGKNRSYLFESMDIIDRTAVEKGIRAQRPDLVIHTVAMSDVDACETDPEEALKVNASGVENVARACASIGATLMAISTDYVFDGSANRPYQEEDRPNPINAYGRSKLEGEKRALGFSEKCLVVRVSGLFGAARTNFISSAAHRLRAGETVSVVADQLYSPSYTADLAFGIQQLIRQWESDPEGASPGGRLHGIFHLSNQGGGSRMEVALLIAKQLGASESLIQQTSWKGLKRLAQRPVNSRLECRRFTQLCGSPLRPWGEAVQAFLDLEVS